jgi:hypothetical protein
LCVLCDITHLEAGRMGGRYLDEPDGPIDVCVIYPTWRPAVWAAAILMSQTARMMCVLCDISYLEAGRMGGRHLDEPDGPVDGDVELAEHAKDVLPPVEDWHLLGQL